MSEAPSGINLMTRAASTPSTGDSGRPASDESFRPRTSRVTRESQPQVAGAQRDLPSFDLSGISPIRTNSSPPSQARGSNSSTSSLARGDGRGSLRVRFNENRSSTTTDSRQNTQSRITQRRGTPFPRGSGRPTQVRDRHTGQIAAESLALMDFESSADNSTTGASASSPGATGGRSGML